MSAPRITASTVAAALSRLAGTVVLDLADMVSGPALYDARAEVFRTLDGDDLGEDDGTLIVLADRRRLDALRAEGLTNGQIAVALTREARAGGVL